MTSVRVCLSAWVVLALGASGCGGKSVEEVQTSAAVPVKTLTLAPRTIEGIVTSTGIVTPAPGADWTINPPEPGRIVEMPKAEGDRVKPGDLLVRFEIPSLSTEVATKRSELQQARARLENAKANVARLTTLVEHGVAAQKELEDARREMAEAQAAVTQGEAGTANAEVVLSRTIVRARFAGVVAKRTHNPGDLVDPTAAILRVLDPERLQVVAAVPVPELPLIAPGRAARVLEPGGAVAPAHVLARPAAVETSAATADVRIAFAKTTLLAAGTPVQVEIVIETRPNALAVPVDAIVREGDAAFVFVAGADNKAHKHQVTLGLTTPREVQIVSGVQAGDKVIVQGQHGLPDGAAITAAS
jgi:RND family efflux transporter MFP subunit